MCPKNGHPTIITYNGRPVGKIEDGVMTIHKFNPDLWKQSVYKYDLLHEMKDEFNPKPVKKEASDKKEPSKKASTKKAKATTSTKNKK